jgi:hypothetical protein
MAYSTSNPPRLVSQSVGANGGDIWVYKDGDPVSTVVGENYFSNATELGLKAQDRIIHMDTTLLTTTDLTAVDQTSTGTGSADMTCTNVEPIGETSIAITTAISTGTVLVGDIVVFSNHATEYLITTGDSDLSNGATLVISPGLTAATVAATTMVSIKSDVMNVQADASGSAVYAGSASTRLIKAEESGGTFLFDTATGQVFTLPSAVVGLKYKFSTTTTLTSNAYAVLTSTATAGDFLLGYISGAIESEATGEDWFANGTTHLGISSNKTTTGGLVGSMYTVECITANIWSINGVVSCTATPATPFTT